MAEEESWCSSKNEERIAESFCFVQNQIKSFYPLNASCWTFVMAAFEAEVFEEGQLPW